MNAPEKDNETKYTDTADKLVSLIASKRHIRKRAIWPESTWAHIGVGAEDKGALLDYLAEHMRVTIPMEVRDQLLTVWDALKWVEGNRHFIKNVPARIIWVGCKPPPGVEM